MTKKQKVVYYVLLVIISALFLFSGISKLFPSQMVITGFAVAGLPIWFMYLIGVGEVLGGIGLWVRPVFRYAYEGLFIILIGAIGVSAAYVGLLTAIFPLVVAILLGIIVLLNAKRTI